MFSNAFPPRPSKPHAPQGIQARQSPRGQLPRACTPIGGGLHRADTPLAPPYARGATTARLPFRGGPPIPELLKLSLINLKNPLHNSALWCKMSFKRQQKHIRQGAECATTPRPYAGGPLSPVPHSRNFLRLKTIIAVFPAIFNGEIIGL